MGATSSLSPAHQGIQSGSCRGAFAQIAGFSLVYQPLLVLRSADFEALLVPILAVEVDLLAKCHLSWQGFSATAHKERFPERLFGCMLEARTRKFA